MAFGDFNLDIWRLVVDLFEAEDDRRSISRLSQGNKCFLEVLQPILYSRFVSHCHQNGRSCVNPAHRSIYLFFRTISRNWQLAELVFEVSINSTHDPPLTRSMKEGGFLLHTACLRLGVPIYNPVDQNPNSIARTMLELLPCLLPKLKSIHIGATLLNGVQDFARVKSWMRLSTHNRLESLETVNLEYSVPGVGVSPDEAIGLLTGVAPNIRTLRIRCRIFPNYPHYSTYERWFGLAPYPGNMREVLENLKELHMVYSQVGEPKEYFLIGHCKRLETLTYTKGDWDDERDPFGPQHLNQLFNLLPTVREAAALRHAHGIPVDIPPVEGLERLQFLKNLTICQNAIIIAREQQGISKQYALDNFFPSSLRTLRLVDVNKDLLDGLYALVRDIRNRRYIRLKSVHITTTDEDEEEALNEHDLRVLKALFRSTGVRFTVTTP